MASKDESEKGNANSWGSSLEQIAAGVKSLRKQVTLVADRLEDSYQLLVEILHEAKQEDAGDWYDLYEPEDEYD